MPYCAHCGRELAAGHTVCPTCGRPAVHAAPLPAPPKRTSPALWIALGCGGLIALLAFGGIVAALVVPNFLEALHKAKTVRTTADLRALGMEIERYRDEHGGVPDAGSMDELAALVDPDGSLSRTDGWDHPLRYECVARGGPTGCSSYRLASPGRDGEWETESLADLPTGPFERGDYDGDLVFGDGLFLRHPEVSSGAGEPSPAAEPAEAP